MAEGDLLVSLFLRCLPWEMSRWPEYDWIRDGVRRAVLLVSDAVEQLGVPDESGELNENLASTLLKPARPEPSRSGGIFGQGTPSVGKIVEPDLGGTEAS